jgi:predicted Zn-dependent peptidase
MKDLRPSHPSQPLRRMTERRTGTEPLGPPARQDRPFPLQRTTLANGLRVWCQPRAESDSLAALLVVRAGSRFETPADNGISHFVEHMVFAGTERWTESEIKEVITRRGGRWSGWAGTERTCYLAQVPTRDLNVALDWLAQVAFYATFPPNKVDKERHIIFHERAGRYGWLINVLDALGFGYELERGVRRALYPHSSLGLRVVGEDASLERLDRSMLLDYYRRHYTPDNALLIVAGGVTSEQVREHAETYFGAVEPSDHPPQLTDPPPSDRGPHRVVIRGPLPTDRVRLMVGARTVGRVHPDRRALEVLAAVLKKELVEEIRYRHGLVYGLSAYHATFEDTGYLAIRTNSETAHREAILGTIDAHLEWVRRGEAAGEAVAEAQASMLGQWAMAMEDNVERASWLSQWSFVIAPDEPVPDFGTDVNAVTAEDVWRVACTYLTPRRSFVGIHQPVVTVARGARLAAGFVGLGLGLLGLRRWQRLGRER